MADLLDNFMQRRADLRQLQEKHRTMNPIATRFIVGQVDPNDPASD
jgi:hypothetical protein